LKDIFRDRETGAWKESWDIKDRNRVFGKEGKEDTTRG